MNAAGFIPLATLMQIKAMMYPGHEVMRDCIHDSKVLELGQDHESFRIKNAEQRSKWTAQAEADAAKVDAAAPRASVNSKLSTGTQ